MRYEVPREIIIPSQGRAAALRFPDDRERVKEILRSVLLLDDHDDRLTNLANRLKRALPQKTASQNTEVKSFKDVTEDTLQRLAMLYAKIIFMI